MLLSNLKKDLNSLKDPAKAKLLSGYFKTGKGEYAEGDKFLGVMVPLQRKIAKKYFDKLDFSDLQKLLDSKIHEYRFTALAIMVLKYNKASDEEKKQIVDFYLANTKNINNWDLVDCSALYILGKYYFDKDKNFLLKMAKSGNLWERRIAVLTTFWFIKNKQFDYSLKLAEILLNDKHDLIHKAVGWMLREIGNRDLKKEEVFLKKHYKEMPRVMLRYAIEKLTSKKKEFYLKK